MRAIARDSGRFGARMSPARFRQLVAFAEDGALRADAPALPLPGREPWIARENVWKIEIAGSDVGTRSGFDAAFLPSGLTVVALGEAGVRLISRAGRPSAELDQPAHRLVVSDLGDRAIALARRGTSWRLARIDLASRQGGALVRRPLRSLRPGLRRRPLARGRRPTAWSRSTPPRRRFDGPWGVARPRAARSLRSPARHPLLAGDHGARDPEVLDLRAALALPPQPPGRVHRPEAPAASAARGRSSPGTGRRGASSGSRPPCLPHEDPRPPRSRSASPAGWTSGLPALTGDWLAAPAHAADEARVFLVHRASAR